MTDNYGLIKDWAPFGC